MSDDNTVGSPRTLRDEVYAASRLERHLLKTLLANRDKGHWKDFDTRHLLQLLRKEVDELEEALDAGDHDAIQHEAVDVVAFAMMIRENGRQVEPT